MRALLIAVPLLALAACADGAYEDAGEKADAEKGYASSEDSIGQGPGERAGQAIDREVEAATAEIEAHEDALDAKTDAIEARAEATADALEDEADKVRRKAEAAAEAIKETQ